MSRARTGDAKVRRQIQQPVGQFALRPGLTAPGAISLAEAQTLVVADWMRQVAAGSIGIGVIKLYRGDLQRFVRYATTQHCHQVGAVTPVLILNWINAVASNGTTPTDTSIDRRRAALRAFFTTCICLGLHDLNPAYSVAGGVPTSRIVAPLLPDQIQQLKQNAVTRLGETKTPAALALLLCGATSREAAFVRVRDVDITAKMVWLHDGGERVRPRWVRISDPWALQSLTVRIRHLTTTATADSLPDSPVAYATKIPNSDPIRRQAAIAMTITNLMKTARIYQAGQNRVESIREFVAADLYAKHHSLPMVAAVLGMSSLDATAHLVGANWLAEHDIDRPAPDQPHQGQ